VEHPSLDTAAQRLGIDHQTAVMRAHKALHPDVAGFPIHFDLGDHGHDRLTTVRVGDTSAR